MPGMLPGMQAHLAIPYTWLAAAIHALLLRPAAELCMCLAGLGVPAQGGGALVVGITRVPPLGAPNSFGNREAVAGFGSPGLEGAAGSACRPGMVMP
jgi:hypothetical protein